MRTIDKSYAYATLREIKDSKGIDVSKYIHEVASSDSVPYSTIIFMNRHKGLPQLATYNKIYERRRSNPLYKNLVNEDLPVEDRAIALSSLMTQTLIHMKELKRENKFEEMLDYAEIMNLSTIAYALECYAVADNNPLNEAFDQVRQMFKMLF